MFLIKRFLPVAAFVSGKSQFHFWACQRGIPDGGVVANMVLAFPLTGSGHRSTNVR
jgi:hypothetical protein